MMFGRKQKNHPPISEPDRASLYQEFFRGMLLRTLVALRPNIEWKVVESAPGWNWIAVYRVKHSIWYGVGFTKNGEIRVDLHIGHKTSEDSARIFQQLEARKEVIDLALGLPLLWESPESLGAQAGRIAVYRPGNIDSSPEELSELSDWAADMIISLRTALTSHLSELL